MFETGKFVTAIGSFIVKEVGDEFIELDPLGKGGVEITDNYVENGFSEISVDGVAKDFDGFSEGDFFKLNGKYKVLRSNDVFTKVQAGEYMLSLPNHKLMEVA